MNLIQKTNAEIFTFKASKNEKEHTISLMYTSAIVDENGKTSDAIFIRPDGYGTKGVMVQDYASMIDIDFIRNAIIMAIHAGKTYEAVLAELERMLAIKFDDNHPSDNSRSNITFLWK